MKVTILLVDDHKIVRNGLRSLLEKQPVMEVIAEAADGATAIKLTQKHKPDVVIMDISMPGLNGIEATRKIVAENPDVKVIALSMHSDRRFVTGVLKAGAVGYLLKDCAFDELVQSINSVVGNETYLSSKIASIMVEDYMKILSANNTSRLSLLSNREREVLQLLTEGKNTKEIAAYLHVSVKTIETHRLHIMKKLHIHNIPGLVKFAIREGLTSLEA